MELDLDKLKQLAEAALDSALCVGNEQFVRYERDRLAAFHQAATPQTVSALIDRVRELKGIDRVADHANEVIIRLQADVDRLEAERRWIPVSERLPVLPEGVDSAAFFAVTAGEILIAYYGIYEPEDNVQHEGWHRVDDSGPVPVTHWREIGPLPEVEG